MSWLDEMEAADSAYPGDVSYPAARTRAGRGLYQLHAGLDDGHLNAARDLIADWYARQANHVNEARPGGSGRDWRPIHDAEANARQTGCDRPGASRPAPGPPCIGDLAKVRTTPVMS